MKKNTLYNQIRVSIILLVCIIGLTVFYSGGLDSIIGVILGIIVTNFAVAIVNVYDLWREDKNKISERDFPYDKSYWKSVRIGRARTKVCYVSCVNNVNAEYEVIDKDDFIFQLDTLILSHYFDILEAHKASFIINQVMIRLDDYKYDETSNQVKLYTSRTTFYNDLVTNRAMDFKIRNGITIRDIYESGRYITDLDESKMSNHIGINGILFIGDKMIFTVRGGNATLSKNKLTSTVAIGLAMHENKSRVMDLDDLTCRIHLRRLSDLLGMEMELLQKFYNDGLLKIHFLGFGRLIYTGGKPQFYFAYTADEALLEYANFGETRENENVIDYNKNLMAVKNLGIVKENSYQLSMVNELGISIKGEAEKSFFANYWHIISQPRIEGIPIWVYE